MGKKNEEEKGGVRTGGKKVIRELLNVLLPTSFK